jgi:hypothetical protein
VVNCFPVRDHEILTDRGFMSYDRVRAHFRAERLLNVACYVDGRLEYHPIAEDKVSFDHGSHRLVSVAAPDAQLSARPTDNHRMWVALPGERFGIRKAGELNAMRGSGRAATFRTNFEAGIAPSTEATARTVAEISSALRLETGAEFDAFLELLGCWLRDGRLGTGTAAHFSQSESLDRACKALAQRLGDSKEICTINDPDFCRFFEQMTAEKTTTIPRDWNLNRDQLRLVIKGASCEAGEIHATSVRYRDDLVRACVHAGYSVHFEKAAAADDTWVIRFTDAPHFATPEVPLDACSDSCEIDGVWCVSVPTRD